MEETLKIGIAVKPQGIKGELKISPLTDDTKRFKNLREVIIDGKEYKISSVRVLPNEVYLTVFGVNDRNTAEMFRGKFLCVKRENAVSLKENTFFVADMINAVCKDEEGNVLGEIFDITPNKTDIIWIKNSENKVIAFPFLKDLLVSFSANKGELIVNKKRFSEVACYED